ncbi:restriction endonuclease [Alteromonas abrolhosensis]|uniref:restriction endonuclease n=1 Tax=Alteromonas abrolhosensis TaxID=1892904 RepID=UPI00096B749E|nr:restriction endonuclease [Alteromonas abrolhosensis]
MKYSEFGITIDTHSHHELEGKLTQQFTADFDNGCSWMDRLYASDEPDLTVIGYKGFAADLVLFLENIAPDLRFTITDARWVESLKKGQKLFRPVTNVSPRRLFSVLIGRKTTISELKNITLPEDVLYILERELLYHFDCSKSKKEQHLWHWLIKRKVQILDLAKNRKIHLATGELDCKKLFSLLKKETRLEEELPCLYLSSIPLAQTSRRYGFYLEQLFKQREILPSTTYAKGIAFENEVNIFLQTLGFETETTPTSGDFGVDLILLSPENGSRTAVQCKDFKGEVGVSAIQEVFAGKMHYQCEKAMVIGRDGFGKAALSLAESTGVVCSTLTQLQAKARGCLIF